MADNLRKFTTQEVLNKVYTDSSGDTIGLQSQTSKETLNAVLNTSTNSLNVSLSGSNTISGDVTITGDLTVQGSATNTFDEQIQGIVQILGSTGTGATPAGTLQLTTSETTIVDNDQLGRIEFLAASEADGSDSRLVGASIAGEAEATFAADNNSTALVFSTNTSAAATERMRIDSSGNVGINVAAPTQKLDVRSAVNSVHAMFSGQDGRGLLIETQATTNNDDTVVLNAQTSTGEIAFEVNSNEKMRIDDSGNVGIGTSSPDYQLELEQAGGGFLSFKTTDTELQNNDVLGTIQFGADDATATGIDIGAKIVATVTDNFQTASSNTDAPTRLDFFTQDNTSTDVMSTVGATLTLGGDDQSAIFRGNVGIGATSPSEALHISSSSASATPVLLLENTNANNLPGQINFYKNTSDEADNDFLGQIDFEGNDSGANRTVFGRMNSKSTDVSDGSEDGNIVFSTMKAGTLTETLRLESGLVGIGISPSKELHIAKSGEAQMIIDSHVAGASGSSIRLRQSRNTTIGNHTAINDNDEVGDITFQGSDGNSYESVASIRGKVDDGSVSDGSIGGSLVFKTGSANGTRMILDDNSRVSLSNNDSGGTDNTIFGKLAGNSSTGLRYSVALGHNALNTEVGTDACVAVGYSALQVQNKNASSHTGNSAVGYQASMNQGTGTKNTALGYRAMKGVETNHHSDNTAVGADALLAVTTGGQNVCLGSEAGASITSGQNNVLVGFESGETGSGDIDTGQANTIIGSEASAGASGAINRSAIGRTTVAVADNSVTLGNASVTAVYMAQDSGATIYANGINFPDDAATDHSADVNTLDNYEEGTYTVTMTPSTSGTITVNSSQNTGNYTKVGNVVHVNFKVDISSVSSPDGFFTIGLPFTIGDGTHESKRFTGSVAVTGSTANVSDFVVIGIESEGGARVYLGDGTALADDSADALQNGNDLYLSVTYQV